MDIRTYCEQVNLSDKDAMYACLAANGIQEINFGADYCEYKYFEEKDLSNKFDCLVSKGVGKNSN